MVVSMLISGALGLRQIAHAQVQEPLDALQEIIEGEGQNKTGLSKFERIHGEAAVAAGADILTSIILFAIDALKYVLGGIAVIFIVIAGIKIIVAGKGIDEAAEKQIDAIKFVIYGLLLVIIADTVVNEVFFGEYGECVASATNAKACAQEGGKLIRGLYTFVEMFVGAIAVLMIVVAGFSLVTSAGDEEKIKKQKTRIGIAIMGILVIGLSELVVKKIIFPEGGSKPIDVALGLTLVSKVTSFVSSFIATLSILFIIYGGYLYVANFGNDEVIGKAKKILIGAVAGIFIALAAFGVTQTLTNIDLSAEQVGLPGAETGVEARSDL